MNKYTLTLLLSLATVAESSDKTQCTNNQTSQLLEPTTYFPVKTRQIVEAANALSPQAVPTNAKYPTINIAPWLKSSSTDAERREIVLQVLDQARGAGSFNIIGHGVPTDVLDRLQSTSEQFFGESITTKQEYTIKTAGSQTGYIPFAFEALSVIHQTDDIHELSDLRELYSVIYRGDNILAPDYYQNTMDEYIEHLQKVEYALESIMSDALSSAKGVPADLHDREVTGLLKVSHYPAMTPEYENANKLLAHSDWSSMTILYAQQDGLEEIRDGRWVKVPMRKGELHVSIGELYTVWSNELFTNNIHRVSNQAADDRLSFAYFFGQGLKEGSKYMEPVVAVSEEPKFPIWSTLTQMKIYSEALKPLN